VHTGRRDADQGGETNTRRAEVLTNVGQGIAMSALEQRAAISGFTCGLLQLSATLHGCGTGSQENGDQQIGVDRYLACKSRTWTESLHGTQDPLLVYVIRSNNFSNRRS
jgi:hypothetical protein